MDVVPSPSPDLRRALAPVLALAVLATAGADLAAQQAPSRSGGVPVMEAASRSGPIQVDGRLREAAWEAAPVADDFVQSRPREGAEPARRTAVRVLYDDGALYVGARLHDDPAAVRDQLVRRDGDGAYDFFRVEIDPNRDDRTGYLFQVAASGAERDAFLHDDVGVDESYDAVWASGVRRDASGWSVELRIPLSQVDYRASQEEQTWGVNFVRRRLASNSRSTFALRSRTRAGRVSQFGELRGLALVGGSALELTPYAALQGRSEPADPANPFFDGTSLEPRVGLDASWSLTPGFTLDAAVHPDFGQVEVDPAVVNLTAFETFFPEKRPFFAEDARLFDFHLSGPRRILFHSRRIGDEPTGASPAGADVSDVPGVTDILAAAKLTGRTGGGTTLGVLGAVTAEEEGRAFFRGSGRTKTFVAQPREAFAAARVRQDLRGGATTVGTMLTGVRRVLPGSGSFDHLLGTALAGGIDFEHQWGGPRDRRYALWGYASGSHVSGSPEALVRLQRDANHLFQRPDAGYKNVDSTATAMAGREWRLQVERRSAEHWTWQAWINEVSPGFVVDPTGFAGSTLPRIDLGGQLRYQDVDPGPLLRSWSVRLNAFHDFRHSLLEAPLEPSRWSASHEGGRFLLSGTFRFHGNERLALATEWAPEHQTERETRGGPLMTSPGAYAVRGELRSDPRDPVNGSAMVAWRDRIGGGHVLNTRLSLELRPASNWEVRVGPAYRRESDRAQFVTSTRDVGHEPTYGARYLFADVERRRLSMEARLDVAFSPDLSLQLFAQPLVASADFTTYKQLLRPRSFAFRAFGEGTAVTDEDGGVRCRDGATCVVDGTRHVDVDGDGPTDVAFADRDFTLASLRGNAVLRWEYRPGSELFLVWQQDRGGRDPAGDFDPGRSLDRLLREAGRHTFVLKVRHHLSF